MLLKIQVKYVRWIRPCSEWLGGILGYDNCIENDSIPVLR